MTAPTLPSPNPPAGERVQPAPAQGVQRQPSRMNRTVGRPPASAAAPVAPPVPGVPATPPPSTVEASSEAAPEPLQPAAPPASSDSSAASVDASTPAPSTQTPAEPEGDISEGEEAKRMARIQRADRKLAEDKRLHAGRLAVADAFEQVVGKENARPEVLTHVLKQAIDLHNNIRQRIQEDPIAFLHRFGGVDASQLAERLIGHGAKKPEQVQAEALGQRDERIAALERQVRENAEQYRQQSVANQIADYKRTQIAPLLQDAAFGLTNAMLGSNAVNEIYNVIDSRYRDTQGRVTLTPRQAAEMIEAHFKEQLKKLNGVSATPGKPASAPKTVSPPPNPNPGPAQNSLSRLAFTPTKRAFTVKAKQ